MNSKLAAKLALNADLSKAVVKKQVPGWDHSSWHLLSVGRLASDCSSPMLLGLQAGKLSDGDPCRLDRARKHFFVVLDIFVSESTFMHISDHLLGQSC